MDGNTAFDKLNKTIGGKTANEQWNWMMKLLVRVVEQNPNLLSKVIDEESEVVKKREFSRRANRNSTKAGEKQQPVAQNN